MDEIRAELSGGPLDGHPVTADTGTAALHYPVIGAEELVYRRSGRTTAAGRAVYELEGTSTDGT